MIENIIATDCLPQYYAHPRPKFCIKNASCLFLPFSTNTYLNEATTIELDPVHYDVVVIYLVAPTAQLSLLLTGIYWQRLTFRGANLRSLIICSNHLSTQLLVSDSWCNKFTSTTKFRLLTLAVGHQKNGYLTWDDSCSDESLNVATIFLASTLASEKPNENNEISAINA